MTVLLLVLHYTQVINNDPMMPQTVLIKPQMLVCDAA